ncbi:helix-turn-helix transcriptional regulator [Photobacterium leiognathi]|uniref:helix-turn-helix transcriptional regulator n=1 Tax=Photobacterium leiognathi TaxID=553611 RepID=UPI002739571E|nr:PAS domain-containing protein [Photobacterium leiognathi]
MIVELDLNILAKFISGVMGDNCEIVIHDLTDVCQSVILIENGYITGRCIGSPATDLALKKIKSINENDNLPYSLNYKGFSKNGVELRSSTLIITENDIAKYMLCINIDDSKSKQAIQSLIEMIPGFNIDSDKSESFFTSIEEVTTKIIEQAKLELKFKDLSRLSVDEKQVFVKHIDLAGIFTIKGNIQKIANILSISEQTIYRYLK